MNYTVYARRTSAHLGREVGVYTNRRAAIAAARHAARTLLPARSGGMVQVIDGDDISLWEWRESAEGGYGVQWDAGEAEHAVRL